MSRKTGGGRDPNPGRFPQAPTRAQARKSKTRAPATRTKGAGSEKLTFELEKMAGRTLIGAIESAVEREASIRVYGMRLGSGKYKPFEKPPSLLWKGATPYPLGTPVNFQIDFANRRLKNVVACGFRVVDCQNAAPATTSIVLAFEAGLGLQTYLAYPQFHAVMGPYILESIVGCVSSFAPVNDRPRRLDLDEFVRSEHRFVCDDFCCLLADVAHANSLAGRPTQAAQAHIPKAQLTANSAKASERVRMSRNLFWTVARESGIEQLVRDFSNVRGVHPSLQTTDAARDEIERMYRENDRWLDPLYGLVHRVDLGLRDGDDPEVRFESLELSQTKVQKLALALWRLRPGCSEQECLQRLKDFREELVAVRVGLRQFAPAAERPNLALAVASVHAEIIHAVVMASTWLLVPDIAWAVTYQASLGEASELCVIKAESTWLYYQDPWLSGLSTSWTQAQESPDKVFLVCLESLDRSLVTLWARPFFLLSSGIIEALPGGQAWPPNLRIFATCDNCPHSFPLNSEAASHFAAIPQLGDADDCPDVRLLDDLDTSAWLNWAPKSLAGSPSHRQGILSSTIARLLPDSGSQFIESFCRRVLHEWPSSYLRNNSRRHT